MVDPLEEQEVQRSEEEEGVRQQGEEGTIVTEGSREATSVEEVVSQQSSNLSENPETGQSELIGEELLPGATSHGDAKEEENVQPEDPVSSTVTVAVQLEAVGELIEVRKVVGHSVGVRWSVG